MGRLAIEFNDADVLVASESELLIGEPGYALVEGARIRTGVAAYREARVKPKHISNAYWSELSLDPESASAVGVANSAELAFTQLHALWQQVGERARDAVFVVPGSFANDQLGILLGLAEECGIRVRAMVDAAVAASHCHFPERDLLYLDAGLHEVAVTLVDQRDEATLGARHALDSIGIAVLTDRLARSIAESFVLKTRFDPLHDAATEQQLYDALPGWLERLHDEERIDVALPHGDDVFSVTIEQQQIRNVASGFYRAVLQLVAHNRQAGRPIVLQVSHQLARWPGLCQELARLDDAEIVALPRGHAARSALARLDGTLSDTGAVRLLKHLPFAVTAPRVKAGAQRPAAPLPRAARDPRPTHVVYRGVAYGLERGDIVVGRARVNGQRTILVDEAQSGVSASHCEIGLRNGELRLRDLSRYGTFVNEKRVSGETVLKPADVIRIGTPGAELHVVTLEAGDGT